MFGIPSNSSKKVNLTKRTSTLTVNPNGGTWNNSTVPQAFSQAPTSTKTISSAPSKTGNSFEGWTKSDGGSWDESTLTYTFDSSDGTLTAGWLANSYILTTVASPLDAGTVTAGGTLDYDSTKTLTATPENITGYTTAFLNWTLSGPGSLTSTTTNPTTFKTGAGNATVTATFTKTANTYTVKFNGNGADSGSMANQSFVYDEAAKPLSANQFIKNNYNFIGWNTKADGTGVSYEPEQSVQNLAPSGVLNLYAVWQLAGYAIQYSANGHGTPPASQIKVVGQNLTLQPYMPDQEETSPRKVYTITGDANGGTWEGSNGVATSLLHHLYSQYQWNTKSNGTGIIYESQAIYTADVALSLYAIWNDNETREYTYMVPTGTPSFSQTLTVTFDANTGDFEGAATSTAYGSRNCEFEGWYTDINFTGNSTKTFLNKDATYYAKWEELSYTIKFELSSNEYNGNIQPYFKYKSISVKASNFPVTLGEPVAEGYKFDKWELNNERKTAIEITDFNSLENKTITLTATWEPQLVTVLEEIYYEMDGESGKYDLVQVIKNTGTVNSSYSESNYTCAVGFTENTSKSESLSKVSYKGNVVQRYFDRNTYTLKYHNEKANSDSTLSTQSFKYFDHNILLENDPMPPKDSYYTFDCWVDASGKKVTCIPAHTANDVDYYARYNQSAPVQGVDFEIERTKINNKYILTIKKIENRTEKLYYFYKGIDRPVEITTDDNTPLSHSTIYNDNSKETVFAWIYFGSEPESPGARIIVNESSKVEVPLKFDSDTVSLADYKQDKSAGTLEKTSKCKDILEYRFQNDEDNDGEWYELNKPLHVEKEDLENKVVKLRRKETFDRVCSEAVDVTFSKKQKPSAPIIDNNINIESGDMAYGITVISWSNTDIWSTGRFSTESLKKMITNHLEAHG